MTSLEEKYKHETEELEKLQSDFQILMKNKEQLGASFLENKLVLEELDKVQNGAKVFKLVGPVLVNKDVDEAQTEVKNRIEYILKETKSIELRVEKSQKMMKDHQEKLQSLQKKLQKDKQQDEES